MDLSNAFDTLNHDLLMAKLPAYGFHHGALKILLSYLSKRRHRTKVKGVPDGLPCRLYGSFQFCR